MTSLFPAPRAAEEFDQVLGGTAPPAVADRYADLLDTVSVLRSQPEVLPRAEFVDDLRSRLMTAAATELVAAPTVVRDLASARSARTHRRLGTAAATLVIVGGTAGMAAAASGSLPGEALYPVKRGVEQVDTALHLGNAARGRALLDQAATRLDEVQELRRKDSVDPDLVAATLDSFNDAADAGSDRLFAAYRSHSDHADIASVRKFASAQMVDIDTLSAAPGSADDDLMDAADTLADIDQRAVDLCPDCSAGAVAIDPPPSLAAAAGAVTVGHLLTRPIAQARADIAQATVDRKLRNTRLAQLRDAAQASAATIPTVEQLAQAAAAAKDQAEDAADGVAGSTGSGSAPVTSTLTKDGTLVPALSSGAAAAGAAVQDLVTGLTSTVTGITAGVTGGKSSLDPVVKGLGDAVDKTVKGLLPTPSPTQ